VVEGQNNLTVLIVKFILQNRYCYVSHAFQSTAVDPWQNITELCHLDHSCMLWN